MIIQNLARPESGWFFLAKRHFFVSFESYLASFFGVNHFLETIVPFDPGQMNTRGLGNQQCGDKARGVVPFCILWGTPSTVKRGRCSVYSLIFCCNPLLGCGHGVAPRPPPIDWTFTFSPKSAYSSPSNWGRSFSNFCCAHTCLVLRKLRKCESCSGVQWRELLSLGYSDVKLAPSFTAPKWSHPIVHCVSFPFNSHPCHTFHL